MVYYNEFDRKKAAWLRELIKAGAIADGEVDERSIDDVRAGDLVRFTQCHWFAGIGIWSYALRLAGWPDDRPVWTGSCPCQPFSAAGKKEGFADRRHLWPAWFDLIRERRPLVCFGEQVSSPDGLTWIDLVSADMESEAYTIGTTDLCAAGVGSPHIRNRTFFVADLPSDGRQQWRAESGGRGVECDRSADRLADTASPRRDDSGQHGIGPSPLGSRSEQRSDSGSVANSVRPKRRKGKQQPGGHDETCGREQGSDRAGECSQIGVLGHPNSSGSQGRGIGRDGASECVTGPSGVAGRMEDADSGMRREGGGARPAEANGGRARGGPSGPGNAGGMANSDGGESSDGSIQRSGQHGLIEKDCLPAGPVNGFWRDAGWVLCRSERSGGDPSWRPVEARTFPLAHGITHRVGKLRGFGDGIVTEVAAEFIKAYIAERGIC